MKSTDFINECAMRGMATGQAAAFGTAKGVPFTVSVADAKRLNISFVLDRQLAADEKNGNGQRAKLCRNKRQGKRIRRKRKC